MNIEKRDKLVNQLNNVDKTIREELGGNSIEAKDERNLQDARRHIQEAITEILAAHQK